MTQINVPILLNTW